MHRYGSDAGSEDIQDASVITAPEGFDGRFDRLAARLRATVRRLKIPGVALGVMEGGYRRILPLGVTSLDNPLPVTPDTIFQVGSITKTMTALALMRFVESGKLDLDAPLRSYLPGFRLKDPAVAASVTTKQLLTHTGGWIGDYFDDFGTGDEALAMMVEKIACLDQVTPPGMFWSYCNTGFNIAGRLLEVLSGQSCEKAIQDLVFQPLGMQSSLFYPDDALLLRRFVAGHERREKKMRVASPWAIGRAGNCVGGAVCSVGDLLSYARFMMDGGVTASGERLLSRPTVDRMLSPVTDASYGRRIALAWNLREPGGIAVYGHGGATHGQQAVLHFAPGKDFAVALLTNANAGGIATDGLLGQAMDIWFGAGSPSPERQKLPPRLVGECVGLYELPMSSFRIQKRAGGIVIEDIPRGGFPTPSTPAGEADPPVRGVYCGMDRFLLLDEPRKGGVAEFLRDDQGRVAWCRLGGRVHPKVADVVPKA